MGAGGSNTMQMTKDISNIVIESLQKTTSSSVNNMNVTNSVVLSGNVSGVRIGRQNVKAGVNMAMLLKTDISSAAQNDIINKVVAKTMSENKVAGLMVSNTEVSQIVERNVKNAFRQENIQEIVNNMNLLNEINLSGNITNVVVEGGDIQAEAAMKFAADLANDIVTDLKTDASVDSNVSSKNSTVLSDLANSWKYIALIIGIVVIVVIVMALKNPDAVTKIVDSAKSSAI